MVDHLTPDLLAAWMDGTLTDRERSAAETHAADCARCQSMLAALVRTMPARPVHPWWQFGTIRWLIPLTAAAVVVATWVGVQRSRTASTPQAAQGSARAEERQPVEAPAVTGTRAATPENAREVPPQAEAKSKGETTNSLARDSKDSAKVDALESRADGTRAGRADRSAADALAPPAEPARPVAGAPLTLGGLQQVPAPKPAEPSSASAAQSAASPPPPPASPAPPPAAQGVAESVTVSSEAPLRKSSARAALDAAGMRPVEVISPERSFRWRAVTPGSILYSMDGGLSWRSSATSTSVPMHAGSSPARSVCWLVGQAGTVLLTTDGHTWQVRPFPERVDLTDVHATDAKTATVTTANQRRFATSDGGATWAPLQEN